MVGLTVVSVDVSEPLMPFPLIHGVKVGLLGPDFFGAIWMMIDDRGLELNNRL